jgi:hypothetical protein
MAPNVKENIGQLNLSNHRLDAAFINNATLPKYLPLTSSYDASEQSAAFVVPTVESNPVHIIENEEQPESSYWDWEQPTPEEEKAKLIAKILEEEECRQAVSTDNIVANLVAAASHGKDDTIIYNEEKEEEGYWDMPSEAPEHDEEDISPVSVSQIEKLLIQGAIDRAKASTSTTYVTAAHIGDKNHPAHLYWDWTSAPCTEEDRKRVLLEKILKEESIRVGFTIEHIEKTLNKFASRSTSDIVTSSSDKEENYWYWDNKDARLEEAPHVSDKSHPNHEYWNFPSPPCTDAEHKNTLLQKIIKEESIRQILSTKHIESNETNDMNSIISPETEARIINSNSPADECYWNWDNSSNTIIEAPHVSDQTHPMQSYWDHPTEAISEEEKKAALIAQILEEEFVRISLSSSTIESSLKCHVDKEMHHHEMNDNSHSYWGW